MKAFTLGTPLVGQVPIVYPPIHGGDPNGMLFDFVRLNFYVSLQSIFYRWLRKADNQWTTDEIQLVPGYYSLDRDGLGVEFRSLQDGTGILATVTCELIEISDIPDVFLQETNQHTYNPGYA